MIGNIVLMPDGSYKQFVEANPFTFEDISKNIGMCIMVHGECVGKITGNYENDLALKTIAEDRYPTDDKMYKWNEETVNWIEIEVDATVEASGE